MWEEASVLEVFPCLVRDLTASGRILGAHSGIGRVRRGTLTSRQNGHVHGMQSAVCFWSALGLYPASYAFLA